MSAYDQVIETLQWDPENEREFTTTRTLEEAIRNPSGLKVESIGLHLMNLERRKRGLTEYRLNPKTGTYDEVSDEKNS